MVCAPCRKQLHNSCPSWRITNNVGYVEKTWCDCQHMEGVLINRMRLDSPEGGVLQ
jgi:hypothetical protein